jgi:hypothetical protein
VRILDESDNVIYSQDETIEGDFAKYITWKSTPAKAGLRLSPAMEPPNTLVTKEVNIFLTHWNSGNFERLPLLFSTDSITSSTAIVVMILFYPIAFALTSVCKQFVAF